MRPGKAVEWCSAGVVPNGHKQRYVEHAATKTYAAGAEKPRSLEKGADDAAED